VHYLQSTGFSRAIVFARTKHGADKIVKHLDRSGIRAAAIHGNKSQSVRQRTLDAFKSNRPPVLVATDIAARGLDVQGISHVINFELPEVPEIYVHRIGRTGRAGATGIATSFCGRHERDQLRQIERLTRRTISVEQDQPEYKAASRPPATADRHEQPLASRSRRPRGGRPSNGNASKRRQHGEGRATRNAAAGSTTSSGSGNGQQARQRRRRRARSRAL
jgi:ATP-dependent RNA helicase RhlE